MKITNGKTMQNIWWFYFNPMKFPNGSTCFCSGRMYGLKSQLWFLAAQFASPWLCGQGEPHCPPTHGMGSITLVLPGHQETKVCSRTGGGSHHDVNGWKTACFTHPGVKLQSRIYSKSTTLTLEQAESAIPEGRVKWAHQWSKHIRSHAYIPLVKF